MIVRVFGCVLERLCIIIHACYGTARAPGLARWGGAPGSLKAAIPTATSEFQAGGSCPELIAWRSSRQLPCGFQGAAPLLDRGALEEVMGENAAQALVVARQGH